MFDFKHIQPFDKSMVYSTSPMVLFATPGMLHGGLSLAVFKEWCTDEKNTLIIPGYCSPGTMGDLLLKGTKHIEIDNKWVQVKCEILNMSFSAHADAQGLLKLIQQVQPEGVALIHGEKDKMYSFSEKIREVVGVPVYVPENNKVTALDVEIKETVGFGEKVHDQVKAAARAVKAVGTGYGKVAPEIVVQIRGDHDGKLVVTEAEKGHGGLRVECVARVVEGAAKLEEIIRSFKIKALESAVFLTML